MRTFFGVAGALIFAAGTARAEPVTESIDRGDAEHAAQTSAIVNAEEFNGSNEGMSFDGLGDPERGFTTNPSFDDLGGVWGDTFHVRAAAFRACARKGITAGTRLRYQSPTDHRVYVMEVVRNVQDQVVAENVARGALSVVYALVGGVYYGVQYCKGPHDAILA